MIERDEHLSVTPGGEPCPGNHHIMRDKLASLMLMAGSLTHDLNNLIAAILGNNSILLRGLPDDSPWKENARQVEATALRALELNNLLLVFAGKARFSREPVDLVALLEDVKEPLRLATAKGIRIEYDSPAALPSIPADAALVRQMIRNLVTNASDAVICRQGTIHVRLGLMDCDPANLPGCVNAHGQPPGEYVYVEVADPGCGISAEAQERMFDPFFTTGMRGPGLGLSVVYGVAEMHAGLIQLESTVAKGTMLRVLFPREHLIAEDLL